MAAHLQRPKGGPRARRAHLRAEREADAARYPTPTPTPPPVAIATVPERLPPELPSPALEAPRRARARGGWRLRAAAVALTLLGVGALGLGGLRGERGTLDAPATAPLAPLASFALGAVAPVAVAEPVTPAGEPFVGAPSLAVRAPAPVRPRADAQVQRDGYASIPGGVLYVPSTFASEDGTYDLYVHFHGNTRVVRESAEHAGLNAIVAVVNLGKNSAPYLDGFAVPGSYEVLLARIQRAVRARGLSEPRPRRVALGAWSGGYGALSSILEHERGLASLDAVLVLDGIHCGFSEQDPKALNARILSPFFAATRRAAAGEILFSITHSEIDPIAYAGTDRTASYLLDVVHGARAEPQPAPEHVQLRAAEGAVSRSREKRMVPLSEASVGSFHVRGYRGNTPEHHMAHLLQMAATVLPELAERWASPPLPR